MEAIVIQLPTAKLRCRGLVLAQLRRACSTVLTAEALGRVSFAGSREATLKAGGGPLFGYGLWLVLDPDYFWHLDYLGLRMRE